MLLSQVQALNKLLFEWDRDREPKMNFDWPYDEAGESYFRDRIEGRGVCFMAVDGDDVVGYLTGALRGVEKWRTTVRSEVERMFVAESHRRAGAGQLLMKAFFDWSKAAGADQVLVEAFWGNDSAIAFYKHSGFDEIALSLQANL